MNETINLTDSLFEEGALLYELNGNSYYAVDSSQIVLKDLGPLKINNKTELESYNLRNRVYKSTARYMEYLEYYGLLKGTMAYQEILDQLAISAEVISTDINLEYIEYVDSNYNPINYEDLFDADGNVIKSQTIYAKIRIAGTEQSEARTNFAKIILQSKPKENTKYTVSFDSNGGTIIESQEIEAH